MKRIIKKIVVFLCATLIAVCSCGCADGAQQPDTRTRHQFTWDELCSLQPGVYVDGTEIGGWTADCWGLVETFEIIGTGLDMKIKVDGYCTYSKPFIKYAGDASKYQIHITFFEKDKFDTSHIFLLNYFDGEPRTIRVGRS